MRQSVNITEPKITIIGAGVWGCALGKALSDQATVLFWDKTPSIKTAIKNGGDFCASFDEAVHASALIIVAVSSQGFTEVIGRLAEHLAGDSQKMIGWLTKGFDPKSNRPLCQTASEILGKQGRYAAISGPSFANEVEQTLPTALEVSANHPADAKIIQTMLHRRHLRVYINDDIIATCVGGAVKNIIALATGISDAMQLGANARAALITRGLQEMSSICDALGGRHENLLGLAGVGDLVLTCTSDLSRNYGLGKLIGENPNALFSTDAIQRLQKQTCEGVQATYAVWQCGKDYQLTLPIISTVYSVLCGQISANDALERLLDRAIS